MDMVYQQTEHTFIEHLGIIYCYPDFLRASLVKNLPAMQETLVRFLGQEDPLEKR